MPRGDGTGPAGMGPMTGRAAGFCAGYPVPGYMNPVGGRGFWGWGRGRGRGWRNWFYATGRPGWARAGFGPWDYPYGPYQVGFAAQETPEQQLDALKQQAEYFESTLGEIKEQISRIEEESKKK